MYRLNGKTFALNNKKKKEEEKKTKKIEMKKTSQAVNKEKELLRRVTWFPIYYLQMLEAMSF